MVKELVVLLYRVMMPLGLPAISGVPRELTAETLLWTLNFGSVLLVVPGVPVMWCLTALVRSPPHFGLNNVLNHDFILRKTLGTIGLVSSLLLMADLWK